MVEDPNWLRFADTVIGAVLSIAFLIAGVTLTVLGHDAPRDLWVAAISTAAFAVGASRRAQ